jgi:hypothetical protein
MSMRRVRKDAGGRDDASVEAFAARADDVRA